MEKDIEQILEEINNNQDSIKKAVLSLAKDNNSEDLSNLINNLTKKIEGKYLPQLLLNEEELKYLNNFTTVIHDSKNYFGYFIKGDYIQIYTEYKDREPEVFQYKINQILNIYSEQDDNCNYMKISAEDASTLYFVIDQIHVKKIILHFTAILSNSKNSIIKSI